MHVLIVCSGNTCRSPLAEALLRRKLEERGVAGVTVESAGTGAGDGMPASEGSYLVGLEAGLDLSGHRARRLTRERVQAADLILCMASGHLSRIAALGGAEHASLLGDYAGLEGSEAEVSDPFGYGLEAYRGTLAQLDSLLDAVADRLGRAPRSGSEPDRDDEAGRGGADDQGDR